MTSKSSNMKTSHPAYCPQYAPMLYYSKYYNAFAYLIDAIIKLTLFLSADNHAIFLAFCSFCDQTFSRVKKRTFNVLAPRLKSAIKVNRILHFRNVEINFCTFYVCHILSNSLELNLTFCVPYCRSESRKP